MNRTPENLEVNEPVVRVSPVRIWILSAPAVVLQGITLLDWAGTVNDPLSKINEYISHRLTREEQILKFLNANKNRWTSSWDIMATIYGNLQFHLKFSAHLNVTNHLQKLISDGVIVKKAPDLYKIKL